MNPLERALARRRVRGARLSIVALVLLVGSSGIVVPSLEKQRRARGTLEFELDAYESTLQLVSDLRAYENDGARVVDEARAELATFVPPLSSRATLRSVLLDRMQSAGIADMSIEISTPEPLTIGEGEEATTTTLSTTTAVVSGVTRFESIVRFLHVLANPRPLILVRQASFERDDTNETGTPDDLLRFSVRLAFVEAAPTTEPAAESSTPPADATPVDGSIDDATEDER